MKHPFIIALLTFCLLLSNPPMPIEPTPQPTPNPSRHVTMPVSLPGAIWGHTYGAGYSDSFRSLAECADGGFILTGSTETDDTGDDKLWLLRTNPYGTILWSHNYVFSSYFHPTPNPLSRGKSVIECSDGGFAVAGSATGGDFLMIRTDASGTLLWNHTYGGPGNDGCGDFTECSEGGFALAGYTNSYGTSYRSVWLVRTDAAGIPLWNRTYGNPYGNSGYALVECAEGGFAIVGYSDNADYTDQDVLLIRTDAAGELLWNYTYNEKEEDTGYDIVECMGGGFALAGVTENSDTDDHNALVVRVDSLGSLLWSHTYGGNNPDSSSAQSIVECPNGGFAFTGGGRKGDDAAVGVLFMRIGSDGSLLHFDTLGTADMAYGNSLVNCRGGGYALAGLIDTFSQGELDGLLLRIPDPVAQLTLLVIIVAVIVVVVILFLWVIRRRRRSTTRQSKLEDWMPQRKE